MVQVLVVKEKEDVIYFVVHVMEAVVCHYNYCYFKNININQIFVFFFNFIDLSIRNKYSTSPYLLNGCKIMTTNSDRILV